MFHISWNTIPYKLEQSYILIVTSHKTWKQCTRTEQLQMGRWCLWGYLLVVQDFF